MWPRTALSGVSLSLFISLAGCCPKSAVPASAPTAQRTLVEPETIRIIAAESRRKEVAALIEEAAKTAGENDKTAQTKAAFVFAVADRRSADLARTINEIDVARDVVIDNLNHLETIAFKASTVRFDGVGIQVALNLAQGFGRSSGRPTDLLIQGQGFFKIKTADSIGGGVGYTRNGSFVVSKAGDLVLNIMGEEHSMAPPLKVPYNAAEISISQNGYVEIAQSAGGFKVAIGQIRLTQFINPHGLQMQGDGVFTETAASGPAVDSVPGNGGSGQLVQGFLEESNVDLIHEKFRLRFLNDWKAELMHIADR